MCPLFIFFQRLHLLEIIFFNGRNPNHVRKVVATLYSVDPSFTPNIKQIRGNSFSLGIMHLRHKYHFKIALGH